MHFCSSVLLWSTLYDNQSSCPPKPRLSLRHDLCVAVLRKFPGRPPYAFFCFCSSKLNGRIADVRACSSKCNCCMSDVRSSASACKLLRHMYMYHVRFLALASKIARGETNVLSSAPPWKDYCVFWDVTRSLLTIRDLLPHVCPEVLRTTCTYWCVSVNDETARCIYLCLPLFLCHLLSRRTLSTRENCIDPTDEIARCPIFKLDARNVMCTLL
jgi:hypothetical protein